ncbi:HAD-IA family hydrolase [Candidatus Micrarchaeota archaeon]|nr:HAD-IA family hydrolase [Candidatus Micrarchaeota archaeon]MBU1681783.1 HAD-IA family hydrolase [Candidatus Micrarchaeota archaeon]
MIRGVLCDIDNTLVDFLTFKEKTARASVSAMVSHGLPTTEEDAYRRLFEVYAEFTMEYEKTYYQIISQFGLDVNKAEEIQQAAIIAHQRMMNEVLCPYPMVKPVLAELRRMKLKIGVVSDAPRNKAWKRLVLSGLFDQFDFVITHQDTMQHKPHPTPFQLGLEKLGLPPNEVIFVGDDPAKDILGAKQLGILSCLALYGFKDTQRYRKYDLDSLPKADFEIERFEDILGMIATANDIEQMKEKGRCSRLWTSGKRMLITVGQKSRLGFARTISRGANH